MCSSVIRSFCIRRNRSGEHGLTESFVILLFLRESRRTPSEVIGDRFTGDVGVFCCFCFLSLFELGLNDSSFAWSERRSGYSLFSGHSSENRDKRIDHHHHCREGRGEYSVQFNVNVNVNVNHMKC